MLKRIGIAIVIGLVVWLIVYLIGVILKYIPTEPTVFVGGILILASWAVGVLAGLYYGITQKNPVA